MSVWLSFALSFLSALLITALALPRLAAVASKIGLMDAPNRRKVHKTPKPLVGGLGMTIGLSLTMLMFLPLGHLRGYMAGMILLVVTGFFDDFREMGHKIKFVVQIFATALIIVFSKESLVTFGNLLSFGDINFGILSIPFTIFCVVGVINAINMIDGLDGLAGGVSLMAFASFTVLALWAGQIQMAMLGIMLCGALVAFLIYNIHPAKLFMGDAGSMMLGFSAAFLAIALTQHENSMVPPVAPLLILAVPISDTLIIMTNRVLKGKSPFYADKYHLHHIIIRFGYKRNTAVMIILAMTMAFSLLAIVGTIVNIPEFVMFAVFAVYFILALAASLNLKKIFKRTRKLRHIAGIEHVKIKAAR